MTSVVKKEVLSKRRSNQFVPANTTLSKDGGKQLPEKRPLATSRIPRDRSRLVGEKTKAIKDSGNKQKSKDLFKYTDSFDVLIPNETSEDTSQKTSQSARLWPDVGPTLLRRPDVGPMSDRCSLSGGCPVKESDTKVIKCGINKEVKNNKTESCKTRLDEPAISHTNVDETTIKLIQHDEFVLKEEFTCSNTVDGQTVRECVDTSTEISDKDNSKFPLNRSDQENIALERTDTVTKSNKSDQQTSIVGSKHAKTSAEKTKSLIPTTKHVGVNRKRIVLKKDEVSASKPNKVMKPDNVSRNRRSKSNTPSDDCHSETNTGHSVNRSKAKVLKTQETTDLQSKKSNKAHPIQDVHPTNQQYKEQNPAKIKDTSTISKYGGALSKTSSVRVLDKSKTTTPLSKQSLSKHDQHLRKTENKQSPTDDLTRSMSESTTSKTSSLNSSFHSNVSSVITDKMTESQTSDTGNKIRTITKVKDEKSKTKPSIKRKAVSVTETKTSVMRRSRSRSITPGASSVSSESSQSNKSSNSSAKSATSVTPSTKDRVASKLKTESASKLKKVSESKSVRVTENIKAICAIKSYMRTTESMKNRNGLATETNIKPKQVTKQSIRSTSNPIPRSVNNTSVSSAKSAMDSQTRGATSISNTHSRKLSNVPSNDSLRSRKPIQVETSLSSKDKQPCSDNLTTSKGGASQNTSQIKRPISKPLSSARRDTNTNKGNSSKQSSATSVDSKTIKSIPSKTLRESESVHTLNRNSNKSATNSNLKVIKLESCKNRPSEHKSKLIAPLPRNSSNLVSKVSKQDPRSVSNKSVHIPISKIGKLSRTTQQVSKANMHRSHAGASIGQHVTQKLDKSTKEQKDTGLKTIVCDNSCKEENSLYEDICESAQKLPDSGGMPSREEKQLLSKGNEKFVNIEYLVEEWESCTPENSAHLPQTTSTNTDQWENGKISEFLCFGEDSLKTGDVQIIKNTQDGLDVMNDNYPVVMDTVCAIGPECSNGRENGHSLPADRLSWGESDGQGLNGLELSDRRTCIDVGGSMSEQVQGNKLHMDNYIVLETDHDTTDMCIPDNDSMQVADDVSICTMESENASDSENVRMADSENIRTADSENIRIADSGKVRMTDRENVWMTDSEIVRMADSETIRIADSENVRMADSENVRMADRQNVRMADSENVRMADSENVHIADSRGVRTADSELVRIVDSENVRIADSENVRTADSENIRMADSANVRIVDSGNVRVADIENIRISDSENIRIADSENVRMADSENIRMTDSENIRIADNENVRMADSENVRMADSEIVYDVENSDVEMMCDRRETISDTDCDTITRDMFVDGHVCNDTGDISGSASLDAVVCENDMQCQTNTRDSLERFLSPNELSDQSGDNESRNSYKPGNTKYGQILDNKQDLCDTDIVSDTLTQWNTQECPKIKCNEPEQRSNIESYDLKSNESENKGSHNNTQRSFERLSLYSQTNDDRLNSYVLISTDDALRHELIENGRIPASADNGSDKPGYIEHWKAGAPGFSIADNTQNKTHILNPESILCRDAIPDKSSVIDYSKTLSYQNEGELFNKDKGMPDDAPSFGIPLKSSHLESNDVSECNKISSTGTKVLDKSDVISFEKQKCNENSCQAMCETPEVNKTFTSNNIEPLNMSEFLYSCDDDKTRIPQETDFEESSNGELRCSENGDMWQDDCALCLNGNNKNRENCETSRNNKPSLTLSDVSKSSREISRDDLLTLNNVEGNDPDKFGDTHSETSSEKAETSSEMTEISSEKAEIACSIGQTSMENGSFENKCETSWENESINDSAVEGGNNISCDKEHTLITRTQDVVGNIRLLEKRETSWENEQTTDREDKTGLSMMSERNSDSVGLDALNLSLSETSSEKAETSSEKAEASSEKAETSLQKAETSSEKAETSSGKAEISSEKAETSLEMTETSSEKAETSSEKADTSLVKAETSSGKAETSNKTEHSDYREISDTSNQSVLLSPESICTCESLENGRFLDNEVLHDGKVISGFNGGVSENVNYLNEEESIDISPVCGSTEIRDRYNCQVCVHSENYLTSSSDIAGKCSEIAGKYSEDITESEWVFCNDVLLENDVSFDETTRDISTTVNDSEIVSRDLKTEHARYEECLHSSVAHCTDSIGIRLLNENQLPIENDSCDISSQNSAAISRFIQPANIDNTNGDVIKIQPSTRCNDNEAQVSQSAAKLPDDLKRCIKHTQNVHCSNCSADNSEICDSNCDRILSESKNKCNVVKSAVCHAQTEHIPRGHGKLQNSQLADIQSISFINQNKANRILPEKSSIEMNWSSGTDTTSATIPGCAYTGDGIPEVTSDNLYACQREGDLQHKYINKDPVYEGANTRTVDPNLTADNPPRSRDTDWLQKEITHEKINMGPPGDLTPCNIITQMNINCYSADQTEYTKNSKPHELASRSCECVYDDHKRGASGSVQESARDDDSMTRDAGLTKLTGSDTSWDLKSYNPNIHREFSADQMSGLSELEFTSQTSTANKVFSEIHTSPPDPPQRVSTDLNSIQTSHTSSAGSDTCTCIKHSGHISTDLKGGNHKCFVECDCACYSQPISSDQSDNLIKGLNFSANNSSGNQSCDLIGNQSESFNVVQEGDYQFIKTQAFDVHGSGKVDTGVCDQTDLSGKCVLTPNEISDYDFVDGQSCDINKQVCERGQATLDHNKRTGLTGYDAIDGQHFGKLDQFCDDAIDSRKECDLSSIDKDSLVSNAVPDGIPRDNSIIECTQTPGFEPELNALSYCGTNLIVDNLQAISDDLTLTDEQLSGLTPNKENISTSQDFASECKRKEHIFAFEDENQTDKSDSKVPFRINKFIKSASSSNFRSHGSTPDNVKQHKGSLDNLHKLSLLPFIHVDPTKGSLGLHTTGSQVCDNAGEALCDNVSDITDIFDDSGDNFVDAEETLDSEIDTTDIEFTNSSSCASDLYKQEYIQTGSDLNDVDADVTSGIFTDVTHDVEADDRKETDIYECRESITSNESFQDAFDNFVDDTSNLTTLKDTIPLEDENDMLQIPSPLFINSQTSLQDSESVILHHQTTVGTDDITPGSCTDDTMERRRRREVTTISTIVTGSSATQHVQSSEIRTTAAIKDNSYLGTTPSSDFKGTQHCVQTDVYRCTDTRNESGQSVIKNVIYKTGNGVLPAGSRSLMLTGENDAIATELSQSGLCNNISETDSGVIDRILMENQDEPSINKDLEMLHTHISNFSESNESDVTSSMSNFETNDISTSTVETIHTSSDVHSKNTTETTTYVTSSENIGRKIEAAVTIRTQRRRRRLVQTINTQSDQSEVAGDDVKLTDQSDSQSDETLVSTSAEVSSDGVKLTDQADSHSDETYLSIHDITTQDIISSNSIKRDVISRPFQSSPTMYTEDIVESSKVESENSNSPLISSRSHTATCENDPGSGLESSVESTPCFTLCASSVPSCSIDVNRENRESNLNLLSDPNSSSLTQHQTDIASVCDTPVVITFSENKGSSSDICVESSQCEACVTNLSNDGSCQNESHETYCEGTDASIVPNVTINNHDENEPTFIINVQALPDNYTPNSSNFDDIEFIDADDVPEVESENNCKEKSESPNASFTLTFEIASDDESHTIEIVNNDDDSTIPGEERNSRKDEENTAGQSTGNLAIVHDNTSNETCLSSDDNNLTITKDICEIKDTEDTELIKTDLKDEGNVVELHIQNVESNKVLNKTDWETDSTSDKSTSLQIEINPITDSYSSDIVSPVSHGTDFDYCESDDMDSVISEESNISVAAALKLEREKLNKLNNNCPNAEDPGRSRSRTPQRSMRSASTGNFMLQLQNSESETTEDITMLANIKAGLSKRSIKKSSSFRIDRQNVYSPVDDGNANNLETMKTASKKVSDICRSFVQKARSTSRSTSRPRTEDEDIRVKSPTPQRKLMKWVTDNGKWLRIPVNESISDHKKDSNTSSYKTECKQVDDSSIDTASQSKTDSDSDKAINKPIELVDECTKVAIELDGRLENVDVKEGPDTYNDVEGLTKGASFENTDNECDILDKTLISETINGNSIGDNNNTTNTITNSSKMLSNNEAKDQTEDILNNRTGQDKQFPVNTSLNDSTQDGGDIGSSSSDTVKLEPGPILQSPTKLKPKLHLNVQKANEQFNNTSTIKDRPKTAPVNLNRVKPDTDKIESPVMNRNDFLLGIKDNASRRKLVKMLSPTRCPQTLDFPKEVADKDTIAKDQSPSPQRIPKLTAVKIQEEIFEGKPEYMKQCNINPLGLIEEQNQNEPTASFESHRKSRQFKDIKKSKTFTSIEDAKNELGSYFFEDESELQAVTSENRYADYSRVNANQKDLPGDEQEVIERKIQTSIDKRKVKAPPSLRDRSLQRPKLLSEIVEVEENKDDLHQSTVHNHTARSSADNNHSSQSSVDNNHTEKHGQPSSSNYKKERKLKKSGTTGNKRRSLSLPTGSLAFGDSRIVYKNGHFTIETMDGYEIDSSRPPELDNDDDLSALNEMHVTADSSSRRREGVVVKNESRDVTPNHRPGLKRQCAKTALTKKESNDSVFYTEPYDTAEGSEHGNESCSNSSHLSEMSIDSRLSEDLEQDENLSDRRKLHQSSSSLPENGTSPTIKHEAVRARRTSSFRRAQEAGGFSLTGVHEEDRQGVPHTKTDPTIQNSPNLHKSMPKRKPFNDNMNLFGKQSESAKDFFSKKMNLKGLFKKNKSDVGLTSGSPLKTQHPVSPPIAAFQGDDDIGSVDTPPGSPGQKQDFRRRHTSADIYIKSFADASASESGSNCPTPTQERHNSSRQTVSTPTTPSRESNYIMKATSNGSMCSMEEDRLSVTSASSATSSVASSITSSSHSVQSPSMEQPHKPKTPKPVGASPRRSHSIGAQGSRASYLSANRDRERTLLKSATSTSVTSLESDTCDSAISEISTQGYCECEHRTSRPRLRSDSKVLNNSAAMCQFCKRCLEFTNSAGSINGASCQDRQRKSSSSRQISLDDNISAKPRKDSSSRKSYEKLAIISQSAVVSSNSNDSGIQRDVSAHSSSESIKGSHDGQVKLRRKKSLSPHTERPKSEAGVRWADLDLDSADFCPPVRLRKRTNFKDQPRPKSDFDDSIQLFDELFDEILEDFDTEGSSFLSDRMKAFGSEINLQPYCSLRNLYDMKKRDFNQQKNRRMSTPHPIKSRLQKSPKKLQKQPPLVRSSSMPESLDKINKRRRLHLLDFHMDSLQRHLDADDCLSDDSDLSYDHASLQERSLSVQSSQSQLTSMDEDDDNLIYAEALWDHITMIPDEIGFRAQDVIEVMDMRDKDWWYGAIDDKEGWFPAAFVRLRVNQDQVEEEDLEMTLQESLTSSPKLRRISMLNKNQARTNVVNEIINAEREYVKHLKDVVEGYIQHARKRHEMFPEERIALIFGNIETIYTFAQKFLVNLEKCIDVCPHLSEIGQCFLDNERGFEVYSDYCNNHPSACEELKELCQDSKYRHFFEACRLLQELVEIPLEGFLLTPVQKICKYPLQLAELLKYTPPDHPDYQTVKDALSAMRKIATLINERKRKMESIEKIAAWQHTVADWDGEDLLEKSSELIFSGDINKVNTAGWSQERYFFLFDHQLIYCKKELLKRHVFSYKGRIDLDNCDVVDIPDGRDTQYNVSVKHAWKLHETLKDKWYLLYSKTQVNKQRWLDALKDERNRVQEDKDNDFCVPDHWKQTVLNKVRSQSSLKDKQSNSRVNPNHQVPYQKDLKDFTYSTLPRRRINSQKQDKKKGWFIFGGKKSKR